MTNVFLFGEDTTKHWEIILLSIVLIALPNPLTVNGLIHNVTYLILGLIVILAIALLFRIDIKEYASIIGTSLLISYLLVLLVSSVDTLIHANSIIIQAFATIITYYMIVLLSWQGERLSRRWWTGVVFLILWFLFYFEIVGKLV